MQTKNTETVEMFGWRGGTMEELRESSDNNDICSLSYFRSLSNLLFSLFAMTSFDLSENWFNVIWLWLFQAGRSDRKEFVKKRTKLNPHASTSNKEKRRTKNFMMMRQSQNVRTKGKRSFRDKQVSCTPWKQGGVFFFKHKFVSYIWLFFVLYSDCPTECTPEKEEAAQIKHTDMSLLFICPSVMYISETWQYISTP